MAPVLTHSIVTAEGTSPRRFVFLLHGILGSGANWRTFARQLVAEKPESGVVLVDLRMHGNSQAFTGPHDLASSAQDLVDLEAHLPGPIDGIIGHSFGGKVALAYLARKAGDLSAVWVLDSTPSARMDARGSESTLEVLQWLETAPRTWPDRGAFVQAVGDAGFSKGLGPWLAMNLRPEDGVQRFRLDLTAIRALLEDYFVQDLWPVLEAVPGRATVHLVVAGRSPVLSADDRERASALAARPGSRVQVHTLENAGHWLHVDDPEGLFRTVRDHWG